MLAWSCIQWGEKILDPFDIGQQIEAHTYWMPSNLERARMQNQLENTPGRHIIFVRFHKGDLAGIFWIYNKPDIANSKVIWAYDMGDASNQEFMRLYPNRQAWLVDKNDYLMPLAPYDPSRQPSSALLVSTSFDRW